MGGPTHSPRRKVGAVTTDGSEQRYWAITRRQFLRKRMNRWSLYVIVSLFVIAFAADFIASEQPILLKLHGELYVFPNMRAPAALRAFDNRRLAEEMGPNDWAVFPLVPWGYNSHDMEAVLQAPSATHWWGTDSSGRDVFSRVVHGSRVSLAVGVMSVIVLLLVGVLVGSVAAYFGGWWDLLLMRFTEIVHSIPTLLLLVTMLAILMPSGVWSVISMMLVIGLVRWTDVARLVRGEILKLKTMEYVIAARALGYSHARVLLRHILPNALSPVFVSATFGMASAILIEGALSFLGFGIPADMASWGGLLDDVRGHTEAWWLAVFPGLAIFITVTVYNLAGEGLRDAIDPRLRM
jgi:peptide/nickel transport system permease protein